MKPKIPREINFLFNWGNLAILARRVRQKGDLLLNTTAREKPFIESKEIETTLEAYSELINIYHILNIPKLQVFVNTLHHEHTKLMQLHKARF